MKKCPAGQYYCFTDKKCKKIPMGYHVGGRGMLEPDEETSKKKNGNGNGNGNANGNGNGGGNGGNGNGGNGGGMGEEVVHEGGSLHNWFKGSKSKDGKPGWVQSDGSPCANEPGETKTPKCYSSKRLAALKRKGKKGENIIKSADRRKREKDPGQQSKSGAAKPTNVKTFAKGRKDKNYVKPEPGLKETMEIQEAQKDKKGAGSGTKDACYHKVKSRYSVWPSAYASGALVKCRKVGAANWGNSKKEEVDYGIEAIKEKFRAQYGKPDKMSQSSERKSLGRGSSIKDGSKKTGYESKKEFRDQSMKLRKHRERFGDLAKEETTLDEKCWKGYEKKGMKTMFGKRYPNCVKKTKKEEVELTTEGKYSSSVRATYGGKTETFPKETYKKKSKKTASEATSFDINPSEHKKAQKQQKIRNMTKSPNENEANVAKKMAKGPELANEAVRVPTKTGNIIASTVSFRGKYYMLKMFFPQVIKPTRTEVQAQVEKVYPGARLASYMVSDYKPGEPVFHTEDWQKVNRKDKTDGLSQKAVDAYRRENPGSKLKTAVTKKPSELKKGSKDANRRKSFCSRMKGMKKRLTSAKTARDPDSRINKALRRWNC
mgnify:CR=1 FL=1|jgi:hypothetical protein